ncbi:MAG: N-6 DNA methylase [Burkholderiales bacterium]|nr:N-6 DNA methylase [Burkholderiales bacterium]
MIEVKPAGTSLEKLAASEQVQSYLAKYGVVLVTDYRDFWLLAKENGKTVRREQYSLAKDAKAFWEVTRHPHKAAAAQERTFIEFIRRTLLHAAPLVEPKDVAWFLASYARDALYQVEQAQLPALDTLRSALEQALGVKFEGQKGEHFFRSTLVQTLFYGLFAAWVLWHRSGGSGRFDWHSAVWSLHVPMIGALYAQVAQPARLKPLGLEEPLDHAANALNRVDRVEFFKRFEDRRAVQYFYEPFLQAFDPKLRKELGVWYTPEEIVQYMVRRVEQVLVSELGIADGLADPQVYVLDPCCGTGAYLVETLRVIAGRLEAKGTDALAAQRLKQAMTERIFGFEILPAPFVVSHLQIGLLLASLGAPMAGTERASVYLTNALTGWGPAEGAKAKLLFPELEEEREAAEHVKLDKPILVVLGNPPYNAFAGVAQGEEQDLIEPYKEGLTRDWKIKKYNLEDLYIRFFRLAERRIAERSKRGVVCFISNHSWVSEPSFVVLRKRLLENFDRFWLENMHGNRKATEYAPDGRSSETVFAVPGFSPGIRQGVAISLWVKEGAHSTGAQVMFREDLHQARAADRRAALLASLEDKSAASHYLLASPSPANRLSFFPQQSSAAYLSWPMVTALCGHEPLYGLNENRRGALISIDKEPLIERIKTYLNPAVSDGEAGQACGGLMKRAARFDPEKCRQRALVAQPFDLAGVHRFSSSPFDNRWCFWSPVRPIWNEPRPDLVEQHWSGNSFLHVRRFGRRPHERHPMHYGSALPELHLMDPDIVSIPLRWRSTVLGVESYGANLSVAARSYLAAVGIQDPDLDPEHAQLLWWHVLAIGYSPAWLEENGSAIRTGFPRVPLPAHPELILASAALGREVATLLEVDTAVQGVTTGSIRPALRDMALVSRVGGGALDPSKGELGITAGWGHAGKEGVTMPGKGRAESRAAPGLPPALGSRTHDIYLNRVGYWKNIPDNVWSFTIGGYQVMKRWLSYRERKLLGRDLTMSEVDYFTEMARRIAAIVLMSERLDENYKAIKGKPFDWKG